MNSKGNTILIIGGGSGIGLAMAEVFIKAGNQVLISGRRESKLIEAKEKLPELQFRVCDVSKKTSREDLFRWATSEFPNVKILINNAGIQQEIDFLTGAPELTDGESEIETNLTANISKLCRFIVRRRQRSTRFRCRCVHSLLRRTSGFLRLFLRSSRQSCTEVPGLVSRVSGELRARESLKSRLRPSRMTDTKRQLVKPEISRLRLVSLRIFFIGC